MQHTPVLIKKIIEILAPKKGNIFIDATVGDGGYTQALFENCKDIKVIAIDQNLQSLERAKQNLVKYTKNIIFVHNNFKNIVQIVKDCGYEKVDGVLYDLGLASWQIDEGDMGISFNKENPLDMRVDDSSNRITTASEILNKFPIKKIADILYKYGDVKNSWAIARKVDIYRKKNSIIYTSDLLKILKTDDPKRLAPIFQALRIYVNEEYDNLQKSLSDAIGLLKEEGKIVVVSFHSGEDRIVKNIFRDRAKDDKNIKILTKKPILPDENEIVENSRSRSAKLRILHFSTHKINSVQTYSRQANNIKNKIC